MNNLENSYWEDKGKHQELYYILQENLPMVGRNTDNENVNAILSLTKIYYDVYNNGGFNLKSASGGLLESEIPNLLVLYNKGNLTTFRLDITENTLYKNFTNLTKLERLVDELMEYLEDKDMDYTKHEVYVDKEELELVTVVGETNFEDKELYEYKVTFSDEEEMNEWVRMRVSGLGYTLAAEIN